MREMIEEVCQDRVEIHRVKKGRPLHFEKKRLRLIRSKSRDV
jgi:hypothetical protein